MLKREEVFVLIKSMTQSEKRHFVLENSNGSFSTSYMEVFKAMDAQVQYDEKLIKDRFSNREFIKQFHVMKNYLKQRILKSLRSFHASNSQKIELRNCLVNIEILYNKELYRHVELELKKAKRIAEEIEAYAELYIIHTWKRKLVQTKEPNAYDKIESELLEQKNNLAQLENNQIYDELILGVSRSVIKNDPTLVPNEELLSDVSNATNFSSGVMHYGAKYFRSIQKGDGNMAKQILQDLDQYFDDHPSNILNDPGLYVSSMNNSLGYYVFNKEYEKGLSLVGKVKTFCEKVKLTNENKTLLKQVMRLYGIELEIYRGQFSFKENRGDIVKIQKVVEENRYKMPKEYLISFWFQFASIEFVNKNYSEALRWVNEILNTKFGEVRKDLQLHTRFLNLMIHFEKQNLFVLRYYLDSAKRMVKRLGVKDELIQMMLSMFSRLGRAPLLEYKDIFKEYSVEIQEKIRTQKTHFDNGYVDYLSWVESKK